MSVLMVFRIALKALARNKMRTALTMLGMIIGVAAVITMVALRLGRPIPDRFGRSVRRHQHHHRQRRQLDSGVACGKDKGTPVRSRPTMRPRSPKCRAFSTQRRDRTCEPKWWRAT